MPQSGTISRLLSQIGAQRSVPILFTFFCGFGFSAMGHRRWGDPRVKTTIQRIKTGKPACINLHRVCNNFPYSAHIERVRMNGQIPVRSFVRHFSSPFIFPKQCRLRIRRQPIGNGGFHKQELAPVKLKEALRVFILYFSRLGPFPFDDPQKIGCACQACRACRFAALDLRLCAIPRQSGGGLPRGY